MKKITLKATIRISLFLLVSIGLVQNTNATTYYWIGLAANVSSTAAWSTTSGGVACACVPTAADDIVLDAGGGDMKIDVDPNINNFTIISGYTGIITFAASIGLTVNAAFSIAGGTFDASSAADILMTTGLTISGGTFKSTPGILTIPTFSYTSGTFTHNSGTVYISAVTSMSLANGLSFYNLHLERAGIGSSTFTIGITVTVNGNLTLSSNAGAQNVYLATGTINLLGNLDVSSYPGTGSTVISGTISFAGTSAQSIVGNTSTSAPVLPKITISNTTAAVSLSSGYLIVGGIFTINTGATFNSSNNNVYLKGNVTNSGTFSAGSSTVTCSGNFTSTGTINTGTSTITFIGGTAQALAFGVGTSLYNLTINKSSGTTATLNDAISITNLLTITLGNFNANGKLTLISTGAGLSAQIAVVGGVPSGNYTVQRYISAKRAWRFLASPISQSFASSWQNNIYITGAGSGGSSCPTLTSNSNGFDATTYNTASAYTYNEASSAWTSISSTSSTITPGVGYRVFVRGNRSQGCVQLNGSIYTPGAVTLSATGAFTSGTNYGTVNVSVTKSGAGWNLVGNPYQATLDWNNGAWVTARGGAINNAIYIWNPSTSVYGTWISGVSTNGGSQYIGPGQSFFISATSATTLAFQESYKYTSSSGSGLFKTDNPIPVLWAKFSDATASPIYNDETAIALRPTATRTFDSDLDALIVSFGTGNIRNYNTASSTKYSINSIPTIANGTTDTVYLEICHPTVSGNFSLSFRNQNMPSSTSIYLVDNYLSSMVNISSAYKYSYSTDSTAASKAANRFMIIFGNNVSLPILLSKFNADKTPNKNVNLSWTTSSEINNNFFDVERSNDQNNYIKIGEVKGHLNSVIANNYNLVDANPSLTSTNYYRLKQVDFNNKYTYSPVLAVDFNIINHASSGLVNIYPVPATDNINISLNNSYKGDVTINIYNLVGKLILTITGTISTDNAVISQNISNLNSGIYLIEVASQNGEFKEQTKFVKE